MIDIASIKTIFEAERILAPAEKFQHKLLYQFGAYCRKVQRNSLKRGRPGEVARPGDPPLRHSTSPDIKDTVFYVVDRKAKSVIIGMVLLSGKPGGGEAMPGVLKHSGASRKQRRGRIKTVRVQEHPSAGPAFRKTVERKLPGLIAGGIMREV